jgi:hypothetical protein
MRAYILYQGQDINKAGNSNRKHFRVLQTEFRYLIAVWKLLATSIPNAKLIIYISPTDLPAQTIKIYFTL